VKYVAVLLLALSLIQQATLNKLTDSVVNINRSQVVQLPVKPVLSQVPLVSAPFQASMPEIPRENIRASYRVSYFVGAEGGDSSGFAGIGAATALTDNSLLSCAHLFSEDADYTKYRLDIHNDKGILINRIPLAVERISGTLDLAILKVDYVLPFKASLLETASFEGMELGDIVYTIGASGGLAPYNITAGYLASKASEPFPDLYQASFIVIGGNSGGAVYDAKSNKIIGVLTRGGGNISLFVPLNAVIEFLKQ